MTRPLAIDLFAGVGGMTLGFEQAGFDVRAAVEVDPIHCAVHTYNFPDCAVIPRSVAGLSASTLRAAAGLFAGEQIDVVFGGPPCQGFSMIGHRAIDDPRNRLVLEFVRLVAELGANYFVFENVKGLTVGRHSSFLGELVAAFQKVGYDVQLPWRVVDAASYGVPQRRERLVLMGAKRGLPLPSYPEPTTYPSDEAERLELTRGPASAMQFGDLPNADELESLASSDVAESAGYGEPSTFAAEMRCLSDDAWHFGYRRAWEPTRLTSSWRTDHSEISQARFAATTQARRSRSAGFTS